MHSTAPVAQQRRLAGPCAHAVGSPARAALPSAPRRRALRCSAIRDDSSAQEQPSLRDRAATLLTGLAASAVVGPNCTSLEGCVTKSENRERQTHDLACSAI